jgi:hypothetical protein
MRGLQMDCHAVKFDVASFNRKNVTEGGHENFQKFPAPTAIDGPLIFFWKRKLDQKY